MVDNWTLRKRPARLERRIDFDNYELIREFLDLTAELSEQEDYYPDMNFGPRHVSMTIHVNEGCEQLDESQVRFAEHVNAIAPTNKISTPVGGEYSVEKS